MPTTGCCTSNANLSLKKVVIFLLQNFAQSAIKLFLFQDTLRVNTLLQLHLVICEQVHAYTSHGGNKFYRLTSPEM